jgi:LAS superfamily LD-carboxypeptidase LdcB
VVRRTLAVIALLCAVVASTPPPASAADTRAERDRARRERAAAARDLDVLRAEATEVDAALDALEAQAAAAEADLRDAEQAMAAAHAAKANAEAAEQRARDEVAARRRLLVDLAIGEFIAGGTAAEHASITIDDPMARSRQSVLATLAVGTASDAEDRLQAAHEDLAIARDQAAAAADAARERQALVAEQARSAADARDQQGAFATRLHERIEARLAEAAALADVDRTLSARLAQEQAALAARAPSASRTTSRVVRGGSVPLRTVRGITVHADIADEVAALVDAAADDGITLGGGGYRNPSDQQRLREAHCPDPASSPASECRPPTARPGHSMHERGLAIDFTSSGTLITSRRSPAFRWLAANAGSYGLRNLPEEPWHWSTNGD